MNPTVQAIIAGAIVTAAIVYALIRLFRRRPGAGGCDDCDGCPLTDRCDKPRNPHRK